MTAAQYGQGRKERMAEPAAASHMTWYRVPPTLDLRRAGVWFRESEGGGGKS